MTGSTGARYERELRNNLEAAGYRVMRAPSSGAGTKHPLPDLLATDGESTLVMELKYSSADHIYIGNEEVDDLVTFARPWPNEVALLVCRWKGDTNYYAVPVDADVIHRTENAYRLTYDPVTETATATGAASVLPHPDGDPP